MAKFSRSEIEAAVASIRRERTRKARQKVALQLAGDLLGDQCTDVKFTMRQLVKLWHKVGLSQ